ncbi:hypothetical protein J6590_010280 [Homalodisca vitripennis]|nr:hypothetical protein J6590_010280 [Homalodisca vitripennis]
MEIAGDKFVSILTSLEQILDNQRSASDSVAYNKSKIDDVFSMMHNKTLQVNVCVREVREMKTLCAKLRKEIGELKHQVFDCRKLLSLPKAELSPKLPPKTVRWADQVQPAQGITKSSLIQRQFSLPTYFSQATISDSLMWRIGLTLILFEVECIGI